MKWRLARTDPEEAGRLARAVGISPVMAGILLRRGLKEPEEARDFLKPSLSSLPSPFLLPDMDRAVQRLTEALDKQESIIIYGDYDADGLSATALLAGFLTELGGKVGWYIPHRLEEGYGFNVAAAERLAGAGAGLIVTVDCGISDYEAVQRAGELGVEVIVTDHHQIPPRLPPALAVINPHRKDSQFPQKELAGVGVAFFLAGGLRQALREQGRFSKTAQPELAPGLALVAIGTVADVAPLTGVNRVLVSVGLDHLASTTSPGLAALKKTGDLDNGGPVSARDVAFRLAPRLNAAGRLGSAKPGLDLLMTGDPAEAGKWAAELEQINQERRRLQDKIFREARQMLGEDPDGRRTIILAHPEWSRGVVGLAASKLAEEYRKPTILLALEEDRAAGSGRSIKGFNLYAALDQCRDLMIAFGGHEQAAGLSLAHDRIEDLSRLFEEIAAGQITDEDLLPSLEVEAAVCLADLEPLLSELAPLAPFGEGNPEPVVAVSDLAVLAASTVGKNHLKLTLGQDGRKMEAIGFGLGDHLPELGPRVSVAVKRLVSTYRGRTTAGWQMVDVKKGAVFSDQVRSDIPIN